MNPRLLIALGAASVLACGPQRSHQVDNKPIASFKLTQSSVRPQVFSFDASMSSTVVGSIATYRWTFGDEAQGAATTDVTTQVKQHAYKAAGSYTVTLVVVDDKDAASDPVSQMVSVATVNTTGPTAVASGPATGQPGTPLTFDGSSSTPSGDLQDYAWDFGDGTARVGGKDKTLVQHTYASNGQFTVTLTVTDSLGTSDSDEVHVAVGDVGPLAVCTWSPQMPTQGQAVMFDASMSVVPMGSSPVYVWDFGDGVMNVPGKMVSHTYNGAGPFTPKLTVTVQGKPSNTASCPSIMLGAAGLCTGDYSWVGNSTDLLCGMFSGSGVAITEMSNGTITVSEPFGGSTLDYTGTWSGNTFTASGTHMLSDGFDHMVTIHGTFSGCGSWTGTYVDSADSIIGPIVCNYTVTATHL